MGKGHKSDPTGSRSDRRHGEKPAKSDDRWDWNDHYKSEKAWEKEKERAKGEKYVV